MPSLDGHSLNKKMDEELEKVNEKINAVHFRIETEMEDMRIRFAELYDKQNISKNRNFTAKPKAEEPVEKVAEEPAPKKKGWWK